VSASAVAALALIAASGAKADVVETFNLSGNLNSESIFGSPVAFKGTFDLEFSNDFTTATPKSVDIKVAGRSIFNQGLSASAGIVGASNSSHDILTLWFNPSPAGTWAGFNTGEIFFGDLIFGNLTGSLFTAAGVISRDLADPVILDPPSNPPDPATLAVPELSTWAMMLLSFLGLSLAAKGRRAIRLGAGKA
jgi:hypothetical protein